VLASNGLTYAQRPDARFGSGSGGFGKWGQNGGSGSGSRPDGAGDGFKFTLKP
jgi:hypothetical protein